MWASFNRRERASWRRSTFGLSWRAVDRSHTFLEPLRDEGPRAAAVRPARH